MVNEGINLIQLSVLDRAHDEAFLGAIDISPKFSTTSTATDVWLNLQSRGDGQDVTGEIRIQYKYEREAVGSESLSPLRVLLAMWVLILDRPGENDTATERL